MKPIAAVFCLAVLTAPAAAQEADEGLSLMEEGARLFFRGLMSEMDPALEELEGMADDMLPLLRELRAEMGPAFRRLLEEVDDWSAYRAPEILPNGDIILRRKVPLTPDDEAPEAPEEGPVDL
ncbi:hypothetical protein [Ponticoccus litoralis]|uniref:AAA+ family ATPase n=1 Tax=Ponticoccus litoralis TaxID=422297 RepID=A0AAW9SMY5_9RHOB